MNLPALPESRFDRLWPLLLPGAYLLHLAEEVWAPPGFARWAAEHLAAGFSFDRFVAINAVAWPLMLVAGILAATVRAARGLGVAGATILFVNGAAHLLATVATGTFSPGLVTGTLVYLPLGALCLARGARELAPGRFRLAIGLGLLAHALVAFLAFGLDRIAR